MHKICLGIFIFLASHIVAQATPKVVVSIAPLHSLVAGVMEGVATPELLLQGVNSEHQGSYSPQQVSALGHADLVFMISDNLESKLGEISGSEAVNGKNFVKLALAPGIITHRIRKGGAWEVDADAPAAGSNADPHIWLDPENAKTMVTAIDQTLENLDPVNAATYHQNAERMNHELGNLEHEIAASLAAINAKPFIVFHDAYQYFEKRFGLNAVGSITDFTAAPASAARLEEIRAKVNSSAAACVFKEPQFSEAAVAAITEGSSAKIGELDPIGAKLEPGKNAYFELLRNLTAALTKCLSP